MQETWGKAIDFVLTQEVGENYLTSNGGLEDVPGDSGGLTKWGISQKAFPQLDIRNLTLDEAKDIYQNEYWHKCNCDELAWPFDVAAMDMAVNEGEGIARRTLQIAVGVDVVDGVIGDKTVAATFKASPRMFMKYLALRMQAYNHIIIANPVDEKFDLDWAFRVIALSKLVYGSST